jgi:Ca2+:H+ antiporter
VRKPGLSWLLVLVPISILFRVLDQDLWVFLTAAGSIIPLAGSIGGATEQLALHAGPRIGGLLNATFGNVTELIVAIFLILDDQAPIVKATITGSILGNLLLVLGLAFLVGGLRHREQVYNAQAAGVHATSLALAVIGLFMPALFVLTSGEHGFVQREVVSGVVAAVLMTMYALALIFFFVTHEHVFRVPRSDERPEWPARKAVMVLVASVAVVAVESELLVGALEPALHTLGVSKFFVGLILVPIVGNADEHGSAVLMAWRNKVDATLEIAIGSSVQVALFVAPVLVFISLAVGHPMDFVFTTFEVAAVALATFIVALISLDGRSNWLEGAQLIGAYVIMAVSFFFVRGL